MSSEWIGRLTSCLQELVDYERDLEVRMSSARWQMERRLGIPSGVGQERSDNVRQRASMYALVTPGDPGHPSEYLEYISQKLLTLPEILLEHPAIARAADF